MLLAFGYVTIPFPQALTRRRSPGRACAIEGLPRPEERGRRNHLAPRSPRPRPRPRGSPPSNSGGK